MTKSSWFACLNFDTFDILIPHSLIEDNGLTKDVTENSENVKNNYDIDDIFLSMKNVNQNRQTKIDIAIRSSDFSKESIVLRSTKLPSMVNVDYSSLKPVSGILFPLKEKKGLLAFRFYNGKIQYLFDFEKYSITEKDDI